MKRLMKGPLKGLVWASCALALACSSDEAAGPAGSAKDANPPTFGKGDAALAVSEAGRLTGSSGTLSATLGAGEVRSYRVQGWGDTRLSIDFASEGLAFDAYVVIDGPLPGGTGQVVAYNDDAADRDTLDSRLEVTLAEPGAYRVLVGSYGAFRGEAPAGGPFELSWACQENCEMPQITLRELISGLVDSLGEADTVTFLRAGLQQIFPESTVAAQVEAQLLAWMADPESEAFPVVPLALGETAQGFFEADDVAPQAPAVVHFDVETILTSGCSARRSTLDPVDSRLPGLFRGSVTDYTLDDCTLQRAQDFAAVLNNLALENGSSVTYGEQRFETIEAAVRALLDSGHRIRITNDRFFADFLGLYYNGAAVVAPLWLETTIEDGVGGKLAIPSPHTHHTIEVSGPLVNTTLMYYMGISGGVSFRAVSNIRSPWTGARTYRSYDSDADAETIVTLLVRAGQLRREWTAAGAGLPASGYGTLGVCNDSTAFMEWSVEQEATIFPLAHPPVAGSPNGAVQEILAALPSDVDGYEATEAFARIIKTLPVENLDDLPFPVFRATLGRLTGL